MVRMSAPELFPAARFRGVIGVWVFAVVVALAIGIFAPPESRGAWLPVGLGLCVLASFAVQLASGRSQGFIMRVSASSLGSMLVMGLIGAGFALAELFGG